MEQENNITATGCCSTNQTFTTTGFTYNDNSTNEFDNLVEKYMMCDKKTLAELLAMKELFEKLQVPQMPQYPSYPSIPTNPWPWVTYCDRCTNPFHDCINCPYHNSTGFPTEVQTNIKYTTNVTAQ